MRGYSRGFEICAPIMATTMAMKHSTKSISASEPQFSTKGVNNARI